MKNLLLLVGFIALVTLSGCAGDELPGVENITKGKKWTLEIGSSPSRVYEQLQDLNQDKNFQRVNVTHRKPFSKPEDIQSDISLYDAVTVQSTSGALERALIVFGQDKVASIEKGGSLLDPIESWPEDQPDEIAIQVNDSLDVIKEKLIAIYQIPGYQEYQIVLPDKSLGRPYDPDMGNYGEWFFSFSKDVNNSTSGRNSVRLIFKNEKLSKIINRYEEFEMVN